MAGLILPGNEPPRSGILLDANGAKLRRFAKMNQTTQGRVIPLGEDGKPTGDPVEIEVREVTIWD